MKKLSFIVCMILMFVGCSRYATNGESLYLESSNGPMLEVPPPLAKINISHFYDLPQPNRDPRVSVAPPI